jgi:RND superfamily putative drug exporter
VLALLRRNALRAIVPAGTAPRLPWYARPPSGRWLFWPKIPRLDHVHSADAVGQRDVWGRVSTLVGRHPRPVWLLTAVALAGLCAFVPTFAAAGVSQTDTFRDRVDSVVGQEVLAAHFPAGSGSPAIVVALQQDAARAREVAATVQGVSAVTLTPTSRQDRSPTVVDGRVQLEATLEPAADSPAAEQVLRRLRTRLDDVGTDVLVGGNTAINYDVRKASERDLRVIIPIVLFVIFVVLALLLRSLVSPLLLIVANVLSFGATIGASALVFNHVLDLPGGDPAIPLYGFVFLVALGIDYSIFLMTRVREEAIERGTRPGILVGLTVTGGVITSAGVVLAATFGALATLPILFLLQIAFIVAFGVLLDTLVVRSLLVPALSYDVGRRIWWPHRLSRVS